LSLPRIAIFASGEGTNLQAILDEVRESKLAVEVSVVISDKKKANALHRARTFGCEALFVSTKAYPHREAYDEALVHLLQDRKIDYVLLAGFMRILSPVFVQAFTGRILNIHPALLPKYRGLHAIERAHKNQDAQAGVTVHFVDEGVDTGSIILQEALPIGIGESLESLTQRVHEVEHRLYPEAIRKVLEEQKA